MSVTFSCIYDNFSPEKSRERFDSVAGCKVVQLGMNECGGEGRAAASNTYSDGRRIAVGEQRALVRKLVQTGCNPPIQPPRLTTRILW